MASDCASQSGSNCFLFQYLYTRISSMCRMLGAKQHAHFLAADSSAKTLLNFISYRGKSRALGSVDSSGDAWIFVGMASQLWLFSFTKHKSKTPCRLQTPRPQPWRYWCQSRDLSFIIITFFFKLGPWVMLWEILEWRRAVLATLNYLLLRCHLRKMPIKS